MNKLVRAIIKNFQSHEETVIDFHDGVNAIIGLTDSGKSALFRALQWCILNKPNGVSFIRYETENCSVTLEFEDIKVERKRDKKENAYIIIDDTTNPQEYKAFNKDIPLDVQDALNMSELNVQSQIQLPFLLGDSPSDVAKYLNKLVHLDNIDTSQSYIRRGLLNLNQEKKRYERNIEEEENKAEEFQGLHTFEETVNQYETLDEEIKATTESINELDKILTALETQKETLEALKPLLNADKIASKVFALDMEINTLKPTYTKLGTHLKSIKEEQSRLNMFSGLSKVDLLYKKAMKQAEYYEKEESALTSLDELIGSLHNYSEKKLDVQERIDSYATTLKNEFPDVCPLCGK